MTATVKKIELIYTSLHEISRSLLHTEEDTIPFLGFGKMAQAMANCQNGSKVDVETDDCVTLTGNTQAYLLQSIHSHHVI